jgi:hypothetical protein
MKERPILFSGPMVRAILDGRKTQTRRPIVFPTERWGFTDDYRAETAVEFRNKGDMWQAFSYCTAHPGVLAPECPELRCQYGQPGDRLWVRETWNARAVHEVDCGVYESGYTYANITTMKPLNCCIEYDADLSDEGPWRPSIHMPRWASRITLEITGVRVERVQDITTADAVAEGCSGWVLDGGYIGDCEIQPDGQTPASEYRELWDSINAQRGYGWTVNPWVWAIEFKRVGHAPGEGVTP